VDLWGVAVLVIIGVTLIVLTPAKQSVERVQMNDERRMPSGVT